MVLENLQYITTMVKPDGAAVHTLREAAGEPDEVFPPPCAELRPPRLLGEGVVQQGHLPVAEHQRR